MAIPHGMKTVKTANLSEPGMKSCQDCEKRMKLHNSVGAVKCSQGIIEGAIFYNQGCSLISSIRNNSRHLWVTPGSKLAFEEEQLFCKNCSHPIDGETNCDDKCESCGREVCFSCSTVGNGFKVLCEQCDAEGVCEDEIEIRAGEIYNSDDATYYIRTVDSVNVVYDCIMKKNGQILKDVLCNVINFEYSVRNGTFKKVN